MESGLLFLVGRPIRPRLTSRPALRGRKASRRLKDCPTVTMLKRVREFICRYGMFARGQSVGVAVSGGADSVCLLCVLAELAPEWALRLSVLHLDHQLRGEESARDAAFVQDLASTLGLAAHVRQADVRGMQAETGENLEQAARNARRAFFLECLSSGLVDRVATGHTRTDQAETVLFRLLRGGGTAGLAGILPVTREGLVRPLLDVDRAEVESFLKERSLTWREDSTNLDPAFARNRIRHQLLPALMREWNPSLTKTLAQTAALARDEELYWEPEIARLAETCFSRRGDSILMSTGRLQGLPLPVARRLLRRAIQEAKGDLRRIEFGHIEDILRLAADRDGHGRVRIPGVDVFRSFDRLRLARIEQIPQPPRDYRVPLTVPGSADVPDGASRLEASLSASADGGLDWERLPKPLELRNWRPGDQYRPAGHERAERIKTLFQEHKVPLWERRTWPVVTGGGVIVWSRRFGPSADYAAGSGTGPVLKIDETGPRSPW